jgi:hypothetical protein
MKVTSREAKVIRLYTLLNSIFNITCYICCLGGDCLRSSSCCWRGCCFIYCLSSCCSCCLSVVCLGSSYYCRRSCSWRGCCFVCWLSSSCSYYLGGVCLGSSSGCCQCSCCVVLLICSCYWAFSCWHWAAVPPSDVVPLLPVAASGWYKDLVLWPLDPLNESPS